MDLEAKLVTAGLLCLFIFISGFRLYRSGKPYSVILLTVHKLISLLAAVLVSLVIRQQITNGGASPLEMSLIVVSGLLFLLAILSGGWLSTDRPTNRVVLIVHRVAPFLVVLCTVVLTLKSVGAVF